MNMKKIGVFISAVVMLFAFTACSNGEKEESTSTSSQTTETQVDATESQADTQPKETGNIELPED